MPEQARFDVPAAAAYLGVSEGMVRKLVQLRRIPFHKIGRSVRIDRKDLDAYLAANRVEAVG